MEWLTELFWRRHQEFVGSLFTRPQSFKLFLCGATLKHMPIDSLIPTRPPPSRRYSAPWTGTCWLDPASGSEAVLRSWLKPTAVILIKCISHTCMLVPDLIFNKNFKKMICVVFCKEKNTQQFDRCTLYIELLRFLKCYRNHHSKFKIDRIIQIFLNVEIWSIFFLYGHNLPCFSSGC